MIDYSPKVYLCLLLSIMMFGCHFISTPELQSQEAEGVSAIEHSQSEFSAQPQCALRGPSSNLPFSSWWEGKWGLASKELATQLAAQLGGQADDPDLRAISASLAQAFELTIAAQQAILKMDGDQQRFATSPIRGDRGVKLIGAQHELMLWCEGDQVYWRSETGESFPLALRSH